MPYIGQVAIGKKPNLTIFGSDYDTPDGTGVSPFASLFEFSQSVCLLHLFVNKSVVLVFLLLKWNIKYVLYCCACQ